MKSYALLMMVLLALAGCSTTYKGTVKGASNQDQSSKSRPCWYFKGNSGQALTIMRLHT